MTNKQILFFVHIVLFSTHGGCFVEECDDAKLSSQLRHQWCTLAVNTTANGYGTHFLSIQSSK